MMAEGRFASLPRSLHGGSLSELPAAAYQPISIHGTLPRRRRGGASADPAHGHYTWDPRANRTQLITPGHGHQPLSSPLVQNIIDDYRAASLDATVDYVKFSREQFIMDCPSEKLRRELEEELKMNCEEPRSHAWYHGAIPRQVAENLVQRDGDFLVRDSLSSPGSYVLTCQWRNAAQHFKINKKVITLNEAYSRVEYRLEREGFDSVPALVRYYVGNRKSVSQVVGAIIFQPINRGLPLRCLEEKYGLASNHREAGLTLPERRSQKRLSLNITNGHTHDNTQAALVRDRCGSQPASLNQVQERRRPLKAHQSESFLPLGSRPQPQPPDPLLPIPSPKSPVFRTGSEPALSPSVPRRSLEPLAGYYVERLRREGEGGREEEEEKEAGGRRGLDRSSYHHAIAALENTSEEEEDGGREEEEDKGREKEGSSYQRPTVETVSAFQPAEFGSRLLPSENKPLEMVVLKRAKELLLSHNHHSIARHLLMADCQVARILGVSTELKGQMGVASGLELVTLPHGQQLRLDLMERHHTMAIGVAVDILGCTGSVEERASTLNRIILVALELKDTVGDLYIGRLEQTWTTLRRNYTQTAITYEKTLKPFYKNLYEGTGGAELWETSDQGCDIMLRHLEAARGVAQNAHSYTANAQNAWQGNKSILTCWRCIATTNSHLILTALSRKLEPPAQNTHPDLTSPRELRADQMPGMTKGKLKK
uniref:BCAR3 adaptor protein, NSP family member n=1 Tax=Myripristis murdjan TaxID=586833 RepID=A0A667ZT72_9TELE